MPYPAPLALPTDQNNAAKRLYWALTLILMLLAMLPTVWPALDLAAAQWFSPPDGQTQIKHWWWVRSINLYVPAFFRGLIFIAIAIWTLASLRPRWKQWRLPLAFFIVSGALGPGLLVNVGFKEQWQRARPYEVVNFGGTQQFTRAGLMTDQCNNNCSFVSGHVACGFFFASLMLVQPRRRRAWALAGCTAGSLIAFARMADMAHWLSDALWAAPITWACSWLVWRGLQWAYRTRSYDSGQIAPEI
jgi:lipid A 4'-phosphatase